MSNDASGKQFWWQTASIFLNSRRLSYALITGSILWFAWLASIILGAGNFDLANQVVGTDYLQFYVAGKTLQTGNTDRLYDFGYQSDLELETAGPELTNFHAFLNPPLLAWLFVPFSRLPYMWSFLVWSILSLGALFASIKLLGADRPWRTFLWAMTWFPIFATLSFGQNSLLSLLILSLTFLLWKSQRSFLAGFTASLILFKPQLIIGVLILWLLRLRNDWKSIVGFLAGGGILAGVTYALLPQATTDYLRLATDFIPNMIYSDQFPLYHLHTLRGFWTLLFPGLDDLSEAASLLISLLIIGMFIRFTLMHRDQPIITYASAIAITILITPHAMIYDWAVLLIPALLLWRTVPQLAQYWKVIFSVVWLVSLLSGPMSYIQLLLFPIAFQFSVPILLLLLTDIKATLEKTTS